MKKFEKIFFSMIAMIMMVAVGSVFTSCTNDDDDFRVPAQEAQLDQALGQDSVAPMTRGMNIVNDCGAQIRSDQTLPFPGEPVHGIPGQTVYKFFVANPSSDVIGVAVKFTAPDGNVYTHYMQQNAAGNWYLERTLSQAGHYTLKYHLMRSGGNTTISTPTPSYIDNTKVHMSSNILRSHWPFSYDGSSNLQRTVYINGSYQEWHYTNSHPQDQPKWKYSQDWNRGTSYDDYGVPVKSPLDGKIVDFGSTQPYYALTGNSQYIIVEQSIGTTTYQFFIAHLSGFENLYYGKYVTSSDIIGYIGDSGTINGDGTGGQSHAHTTMWSPGKISIDFDFSADD